MASIIRIGYQGMHDSNAETAARELYAKQGVQQLYAQHLVSHHDDAAACKLHDSQYDEAIRTPQASMMRSQMITIRAITASHTASRTMSKL